MIIPFLTWWQSAHLNFSKNSHFMNCFLAACVTLRLLTTTSLVETLSNAGSLSFKKEGRLGFLLKASWLGLNLLWSVFLALIAHDSTVSKLQCVSSRVFFTIPPNIPLCRSFNQLLHGLSAGVVCSMIFKFFAMSQNDWILNTLLLSVRLDPEVPKYIIQHLNIALMMSELSLLGILTPTLYLVAWSIRWSTLLPLISLLSMAIFLLKYDPNVNPTIGLGSVFLQQIHTSQEFANTCKSLINSGSHIPAFLTKSHNFLLLEWLNCLCNFVAIIIFSDLFLEEIF